MRCTEAKTFNQNHFSLAQSGFALPKKGVLDERFLVTRNMAGGAGLVVISMRLFKYTLFFTEMQYLSNHMDMLESFLAPSDVHVRLCRKSEVRSLQRQIPVGVSLTPRQIGKGMLRGLTGRTQKQGRAEAVPVIKSKFIKNLKLSRFSSYLSA